jgi:hypothetical protein
MAEVKVPGVGAVDQKWVYGGAALVMGIVVYAWFKRSQASAVAEVPVQAPVDEFDNPNPVRSVVDLTNPEEIRTNTQWTAKVTAELGNLGFDSTYLATILGKYLGRQALTLEEQAVIRVAWAYAGKPPEGPDSFVTGGTEGPGLPTKATVSEGQHVDPWVANMNAQHAGLNLSKDKLRTLNPTLNIAQANKFGYINAANPANRAGGGPVIDVFNVGTTREISIR